MALSFGGALEALKSGELISRAGVSYRYVPRTGSVIRSKVESGIEVSTTAQAFGMDEILAEDWIIAGYEQQGIKQHGADQETLTLSLDLGQGSEPVKSRDVHIPGANLGAGVNRS